MYFIADKVLKTFAARNIPPSEFIAHILYTVQVYSVYLGTEAKIINVQFVEVSGHNLDSAQT